MNTGELDIKDNKVVQQSGDSTLLPWYQSAMETTRNVGDQQNTSRQLDAKLESAWKDAISGKSSLDEAWNTTKHVVGSSLINSVQPYRGDDVTQDSTSKKYKYVERNPHDDDKAAFAKGQAAFERGDIHDAIFYLEAAVKQDDMNAEAWRLLGQSHAENDQDPQAIICLERAVERDPYNLQALLALGVSYVNELDHNKALKNLQAWVQHNPRFAGLKIVKDEYSDGSLVDEVMQLMIKAQAHSKGQDPDVLEVLGVLYNVSRDYDNAVKSFKDALTHRPDDYSLWNKIGATLANSARSEQAMPAYHRALKMRPKYARGYLNLGIAHANVNNYAEAARCYLTSLTLNPKAEHIWSYLRIAFTCLNRFDLATMTDKRDVSVFQGEFSLPTH